MSCCSADVPCKLRGTHDTTPHTFTPPYTKVAFTTTRNQQKTGNAANPTPNQKTPPVAKPKTKKQKKQTKNQIRRKPPKCTCGLPLMPPSPAPCWAHLFLTFPSLNLTSYHSLYFAAVCAKVALSSPSRDSLFLEPHYPHPPPTSPDPFPSSNLSNRKDTTKKWNILRKIIIKTKPKIK